MEIAYLAGMRAPRMRANSANATATDEAASTIGPAHPAHAKAAANSTCASQEDEIQGSPVFVKE